LLVVKSAIVAAAGSLAPTIRHGWQPTTEN